MTREEAIEEAIDMAYSKTADKRDATYFIDEIYDDYEKMTQITQAEILALHTILANYVSDEYLRRIIKESPTYKIMADIK